MTLGYAVVAQGGFYRPQAQTVAALAAVLAVAVGVRSPRLLVDGTAGFALLLAGLLASAAATGWPAETRLPAAALVAGFGAFLAGRRIVLRGDRSTLLVLLAWVGAGAAILGLTGLAFHREPWAMFATDLWRIASSLTYANAAGGLFLLTLPAALLLQSRRRDAASRVAAFLILTALFATLSRGALAGAAVFLVVTLAMGGRSVLGAALCPVAGACVATLALLPSIVGPARPVAALVGIAAGAAVSFLPPPSPRHVRRLLLAGGVLLLAAVPLLAGAGLARLGASRLDLGAEPRFAMWAATWERALERPVFGTGPGTFAEESGRQIVARFAHNEYVQTMAETGLVGMVAVAGAIVAFALWALRRKSGATSAVAIAACAAFLTHSAADFIWRFPLLVALAFLWLAIAATTQTEVRT